MQTVKIHSRGGLYSKFIKAVPHNIVRAGPAFVVNESDNLAAPDIVDFQGYVTLFGKREFY